MQSNHFTFLAGLLIVSTVFYVSCLSGVYYEEYEVMFHLFMSGELTAGNDFFDDYLYFSNLFLTHLFAVLFSWAPSINWISIVYYTGLALSFGLLLSCLGLPKSSFGMLLFSCIVILLFDNLIILNYTRVSFIACFSSLIYILQSDSKRSHFVYILAMALYTLGILIRPESGVMAFMIVIIWTTLVSLLVNKEKLCSLVKYLLFPLVLTSLVTTWLIYDINKKESFFTQIEPELEYEILMRQNIVDIAEMMNTRDSLRYLAVTSGIWGDSHTNDAHFIRSLVSENTVPNFRLIRLKELAWHIWNSAYLSLFLIHSLAFLLLAWINQKNRKMVASYSVFHFTIISFLIIMGTEIKLVERVYAPLLMCTTILYFREIDVFIAREHSKSPLLPTLSLLPFVGLGLVLVSEVPKQYNEEALEFQSRREQLENSMKGKRLYLTGTSVTYGLSMIGNGVNAFNRLQFDKASEIDISLIMSWATLPAYTRYLAHICNCNPNSYKEYFHYLLQSSDKKIFLLSEEEAQFLSNYLSGVHGLEISWEKLPDEPGSVNQPAFIQRENDAVSLYRICEKN